MNSQSLGYEKSLDQYWSIGVPVTQFSCTGIGALLQLYRLLYLELKPYYWNQSIAKKFSGVHTTAYFGLSDIMVYFCEVEQHMGLKDESNRTPLSWAAEYRYASTVLIVIQRNNVNINSKDDEGKTPLIWAATNADRSK